MKRIFALLMVAAMLLTMTACEIRLNGFGPSDDHHDDQEPAATISPMMPTIAPEEFEPPMPSEPVMEEPMAPTEPVAPTEPAAPTSCPHDYTAATCDAPAKCALCGETKGDALGHDYQGGDCDTAGKCSRCGKKGEKPSGHTDGWGGKCSVCGAKTDRYYDIQKALDRSERYPKYIGINYDLICNEYDLYNMTKELKYFNDAHEHTLEIYEYLKKVISLCEDYKELDMLTDECRDLLLEMPTVPGSTSSSAIRSYISDAKGFARKASRISVIYNVLCDDYELPGV